MNRITTRKDNKGGKPVESNSGLRSTKKMVTSAPGNIWRMNDLGRECCGGVREISFMLDRFLSCSQMLD